MTAEDINRRFDALGLDFHFARGVGGHWVLHHAGAVALFLCTDEDIAARDARFFLCGLTHAARHAAGRPADVHTMLSRLEELAGMPAEKQIDLPGWVLR
jgi:hypothetical protein